MGDFIISDFHIPYCDERALNILFKIQYSLRPKNVVIAGDAFDFPKISRFNSDPLDNENFPESLEKFISMVERLQRYSKVTFLYGNHEMRFRNMIWNDVPYLAGSVSLNKIIQDRLKEKITIDEGSDKETIHSWDNNNLLICHANCVRMHSGYTAKGLVDKFGMNLTQGHTHRLGTHYVRKYDKTIVAAEIGCFCNMNPQYVAFPNWQQGFVIYQRIGKTITIETVAINDGKCVFRGKLINGKG